MAISSVYCRLLTGLSFLPRSSIKFGGFLSKNNRYLKTATFLQCQSDYIRFAAPVTMKRFIEPRYIDVTGYVPNGEVIKMMEQAGQIATRRYWIGNNGISCGTKFGILAGIDKFDFRHPLFPEDYVHVKAIVNFVSQHSLEVKINVYAEDLSIHEQRLTNSATVWYVAAEVVEDRRVRIMQLPPLHYESSEDENEGYRRYQLQKDKRITDYQLYIDYNTGRRRLNEDWNPNIDHKNFSKHTVPSSQMSLDRIIQASDCSSLGFSNAATVIELMDTTAVMAASKHCDNPCKTLSIDSITFHHPIRIDSLLTTVAKISTTSDHHLHVKIVAIAEELNTGQRHFVANASFRLISMDKNGNPIPVPPLLTFADLEQLRL